MSKYIESISTLSDPKMKAARRKRAKLKVASGIKSQASKISIALGGANRYANGVYARFASKNVLSRSQVSKITKNLERLYAGLKATAKRSQFHLAHCIHNSFPTNKVLAQLEANYALQAKIAALIIQAKTSELENEEVVSEEVLPVDDAGYVVDPNEVVEQPESGVVLDDEATANDDTIDEVVAEGEEDPNAFDPDKVSRRRWSRRKRAEDEVLAEDDVLAEDEEIVPVEESVSARRRWSRRKRAEDDVVDDTTFTSEDVDLNDVSLDETMAALIKADIADPSVPEVKQDSDGLVNQAGDGNETPEDLSIVKEVEAKRALRSRTAARSFKSKMTQDQQIKSLFSGIVDL